MTLFPESERRDKCSVVLLVIAKLQRDVRGLFPQLSHRNRTEYSATTSNNMITGAGAILFIRSLQ